MKWIVPVVILFFVLPSAAIAQTSRNTYIGAFLDDTHSTWCVTDVPPYSVGLWVWAKPGISGLLGATFDIEWSGVVLDGDIVYHPNIRISPTKCKPPCPDFSKGYLDCQSDWVWLFHQTILITSSDPVIIDIHPFFAEYEHVVSYNCDDIPEPAVVLSNVFINTCGPLPVESTTWGAIKSLYR
jgi:hypothetical protein